MNDLFTGFRKKPLLLLILFLQFFITVYSVFQCVYHYGETIEIQKKSNNVYTDYDFCPIKMNLDALKEDDYALKTFVVIFNELSEQDAEKAAHLYSDLRKVKNLLVIENTSSVNSFKIFISDIRTSDGTPIAFSNGRSDFEYYVGSDKMSFSIVGSDYSDYFDLSVSEGRTFTAEDFDYSKSNGRIPVLLGQKYAEYLHVSDIITLASSDEYLLGFDEGTEFEVAGFLKPGTVSIGYQCDLLYGLDNYIIFPMNEAVDFSKDAAGFSGMHRLSILGSIYLAKNGKAEEVRADVNALLKKYDLDRYIYCGTSELHGEEVMLNNYNDEIGYRIFATGMLLVFMLLSIVMMTVNIISENIKTYAIHMLTGSTTGDIVRKIMIQITSFFAVGGLAGFAAFYAVPIFWVASSEWSIRDFGKRQAFPFEIAMKYAPAIVIGFFLVSLLVCVPVILLKLKTYDLSMLIRSKEAKKHSRQPVYKIILASMLAIISIFTVYIASFNTAAAASDMYFRHFYTANTEQLVISDMPAPGQKHLVTLDYADIEGSFSLHRLTSAMGASETGLVVRGVYYKGNMMTPNMIRGRFFTEEEMISEENICIIGQNVTDEFLRTDENGETYFLCGDKEYRVIGVMGKEEGLITWLDSYIFIPLGNAVKNYKWFGQTVVDANTKEEAVSVAEELAARIGQRAAVGQSPYSRTQVVPRVTDTYSLMLIMAFLNCIVFGIYYVDKTKYHAIVRKFIGFSKFMIFRDTMRSYTVLAAMAFAAGNALMFGLTKTVLSEVDFLKYYRIDIPVIAVSFAVIVVICALFAAASISMAYRKDTSSSIRG